MLPDINEVYPEWREHNPLEPGKFGGEPGLIVALWLASLEDRQDESIWSDTEEVEYVVWYVTPEDRTTYNDVIADTCEAIIMWERSDGCVCHEQVTLEQLDEFRADCDAEVTE